MTPKEYLLLLLDKEEVDFPYMAIQEDAPLTSFMLDRSDNES